MKKLIADLDRQEIYQIDGVAQIPPIATTPKPASRQSRGHQEPKEADSDSRAENFKATAKDTSQHGGCKRAHTAGIPDMFYISTTTNENPSLNGYACAIV